jgi:hypothetical protein
MSEHENKQNSEPSESATKRDRFGTHTWSVSVKMIPALRALSCIRAPRAT